MKIVMVLTSHNQLGNTGRKTGFWLEEFAAPYFVFRDAGVQLTLASPKGGQPPIDPKSDAPENQTDAMARFKQDPAAQRALSQTIKLADAKAEDYDSIFYVGGHGPMWDLVDNPVSIALIEAFYKSGKPVAAVCHSPAVFHKVTYKGAPLVTGKRVTGFTNGEEAAVQLTHVVPFLVEDELKRVGGLYEKAADWQPFRASADIGLEMDEADDRADKKIVAPVHVLWGAKNTVGQEWDILATWRAKATSTVTGHSLDCGHFLQEERPEEILDELQNFFGAA